MSRLYSNSRERRIKGRAIIVISSSALLVSSIAVPAFASSFADGSDGSSPIAVGSSGAYVEPTCSPTTNYDSYSGEVGAVTVPGHTRYIAPSTGGAGSSTNLLLNIDRAHNMYAAGHGVGAGTYFFLGGPDYSSYGASTTAAEAYIWGEDQAILTNSDYHSAQTAASGDYTNLFFVGDAEISSLSQQWGWVLGNSSLNQQVINGFISWFQTRSANVEIYSSPSFWNSYMGGVSLSTAEWTSQGDYGPITPCPTGGFTGGPGGTVAQFFGGTTSGSNNALNWQWTIDSGAPATSDYDQFALAHYGALFGVTVNS